MKKILFALLFVSATAITSWPQAFENLGTGARARGMSGAFAPVADDAYSVFWNPAGLGSLRKKELAFYYEDMYGLDLLNYGSFVYVHPKIAKGTVGFAWTRLGTSAQVDTISYAENTFIVSYGRKFANRLSLGGSLKYFSLNYTNRASGVGVDFGAGYEVLKNYLNASFVWYNLNNPLISWDTLAIDKIPSNIDAGLAWKPLEGHVFAVSMNTKVDTKPNWSLGWEGWFVKKMIAFRAGASTLDNMANYSVGTGLELYKGFRFDYTLEKHYSLGYSSLYSLNLKF